MASLISRSILLPLLVSTALAQELPKRDNPRDFDLEPKLMLNDLPDITLPAPHAGDVATSTPSLDVRKLEAEVEKAQKNATWRARLSRAGVLSKVEGEKAALKVVQLTKDLENARLQAAAREVEEKRLRAAAGDVSKEVLAEAETSLAAATDTARAATTKWQTAQRAAAELSVQRERKLLAVGAGSRSSVRRAEAALQSLPPLASP
jgi:hypothetical protein